MNMSSSGFNARILPPGLSLASPIVAPLNYGQLSTRHTIRIQQQQSLRTASTSEQQRAAAAATAGRVQQPMLQHKAIPCYKQVLDTVSKGSINRIDARSKYRIERVFSTPWEYRTFDMSYRMCSETSNPWHPRVFYAGTERKLPCVKYRIRLEQSFSFIGTVSNSLLFIGIGIEQFFFVYRYRIEKFFWLSVLYRIVFLLFIGIVSN